MHKVLIAGGSGMVGQLILLNALRDEGVSEVVSLVRRKSDLKHEKLTEIVVSDFKSYLANEEQFKGVGIAFFCIGVYTGAVPDDKFKEITVDYAVGFAKMLQQNSSDARLCFLSGAGADRKEKSRMSFAKYKGMAENQIASMNLGGFHSFRPGYIYPVTQRSEPNFTYKITRFLYPVIRLFGKNTSIKSTELAKAMFGIGLAGYDQEILENRDIRAWLTIKNQE